MSTGGKSISLGATVLVLIVADAHALNGRDGGTSEIHGSCAPEYLPRMQQQLGTVENFNRLALKSSKLISLVADGGGNIQERLAAVRGLGCNLSLDEISALYTFLLKPCEPCAGGSIALAALKNDVFNVLRHQNVFPSGLAKIMIAIYHDAAQDGTVRDYALQHLGALCGGKLDPLSEERENIINVLREATGERCSRAGTALLALHRVSQRSSFVDEAELNRIALQLVRSSSTDLATRITAIQVCAERDIEEALPSIAECARSCNSVHLRLSATAALRRLKKGALQRLSAVWDFRTVELTSNGRDSQFNTNKL